MHRARAVPVKNTKNAAENCNLFFSDDNRSMHVLPSIKSLQTCQDEHDQERLF